MSKIDKISVVEQLTKSPYANQRIKVYIAPGVTANCIQPAHCINGFGRPDENDRGCYGDKCPSTDLCKEVAKEGLRWEYVR